MPTSPPPPTHPTTHSAHPIAPSAAAAALKAAGVKGPKHKRTSTARSGVTWQWRAFDNPARGDGLRLSHWTKCLRPPPGAPAGTEPAPADGGRPYPFAAANVHPKCLRYDDEEWGAVIPGDPSWTRAETDYLLDALDAHGQRFHVVADRYKVRKRGERGESGTGRFLFFVLTPSPHTLTQFEGGPPRTLEDIKDRYYAIARALLTSREGGAATAARHAVVREPYCGRAETERKAAADMLLARTPADDARDAEILEAAKKVEAARRAEAAAARRAAPEAVRGGGGAAAASPAATPDSFFLAPLDFAPPPPLSTPSLFDADARPHRPAPGAASRAASARAAGDAQTARAGGPRAAKALDAALAELGLSATGPSVPTRATCGAWLALRLELLAMLESKRKLTSRLADEGRGKRAPARRPPARYEG